MKRSQQTPVQTQPAAEHPGIGELSISQCWARAREASVGRVAVVVDGTPDIFPVNHVVDHGSIVFRTGAGTKLTAGDGRAVAYETDGVDPRTGDAWSVVVRGIARRVPEPYGVLEALLLPLTPWHSGPKPWFIRIEPVSVTGRSFHPRAGSVPRP